MYAILFLVGFFGFVGMAGLSSLHSGHGARAGNPSHGARVHHGSAKGPKAGRGRSGWAISPFDLLAYATGAGAVGEVLRQQAVAPFPTALAAFVGALVFNFGLAKPILNALLRFESRQSEGLEGQIAQRGEAATRFDAQGRGLVQLALDGQNVQVLGFLDPEEQARGVRVAKGDALVVVDIDPAKNTCRVTRELAS